MTIDQIISFSHDPWKILNLPVDANDNDVAIAFENSRHPLAAEAMKLLETEERRALVRLLSPKRENPEKVGKNVKIRPDYKGPGLWFRILNDIFLEKSEISQ